jgi:hypothetical protein
MTLAMTASIPPESPELIESRVAQCDAALRAYVERSGSLSEYDRAVEEKRLADEFSKDVPAGRKYAQDRWLYVKLGPGQMGTAASYRYTIRSLLRGEGEELWRRLDRDLRLSVGVTLASEARAMTQWKRPVQINVAVARVLDQYDRRPKVVYGKDGKITRSGAPVPRGHRSQKTTLLESGEPPEPSAPAASAVPPDDSSMRRVLLAYMTEQLSGIPKDQRAAIFEASRVDAEHILRAFSQRVRRATTAHLEHTIALTRRDVVSACNKLMLQPPRPGRPVDLKVMRKLYRQQAAPHHPDRTDDPERHLLYRQLTEACDVLVRYNETMEGDLK